MGKHCKNSRRCANRRYGKNSRRIIRRKSFTRKLQGGGDFGAATWNSSMVNPYTMYSPYDITKDSSYPSLGALSARNINGGAKNRRRTYKKLKNSKKGGNYAGVPLGTGPPFNNGTFFTTLSSSGALSSGSILTGNGLSTTSEVYDNKNYLSALV